MRGPNFYRKIKRHQEYHLRGKKLCKVCWGSHCLKGVLKILNVKMWLWDPYNIVGAFEEPSADALRVKKEKRRFTHSYLPRPTVPSLSNPHSNPSYANHVLTPDPFLCSRWEFPSPPAPRSKQLTTPLRTPLHAANQFLFSPCGMLLRCSAVQPSSHASHVLPY